ncbi:MAG: M16 family metallopeptidase, partial [Candidatus Neomarinimicrobiota bacterium]
RIMKAQPRILPFLFLMAVTTVRAGEALSAKILDNELQVIVVENHTVPLVTIELIVRNGSFNEAPEENGLANFHAHMFCKANQAYPGPGACLERTRELGMVTGSNVQEEWEHFFGTLPRDSLRSGLELMRQSLLYPLFMGDELGREKRVILDQMDRQAATPAYHLAQALRKKLWGKNDSRKNYLGDPEVIRSVTPDQMRLIHGRYVIPNNAALLVSGDVKPGEVFRQARELFGDWKPGPDPSRVNPIPPMVPLPASEDTVVIQAVNNAEIVMAWHGPSVTADVKGTFAADVFSFILNQKISEFQKNLVDSGIALSADIIYFTQKHIGPILISVSCRPQKFWEAYEALRAEVERFADPGYFTDEQLANAKTLLEVDAVYRGDKASNLIHEVAFWWAVAGLDYYRDYLKNLRAVSHQDIADYVKRYIIDQPHVTAAMVSKQTQQQLKVVEGSLTR